MNATTPQTRVGIIAVPLPDDGPALRCVWLDQDTLLVAHDPRYLNRRLVDLVLREQLGNTFVDIDEQTTGDSR